MIEHLGRKVCRENRLSLNVGSDISSESVVLKDTPQSDVDTFAQVPGQADLDVGTAEDIPLPTSGTNQNVAIISQDADILEQGRVDAVGRGTTRPAVSSAGFGTFQSHQPMIVSDSPRPVPLEGGLEMTMSGCMDDVEGFASDVDVWRDVLRHAGWFKDEPSRVSNIDFPSFPAPQRRFCHMKFGSKCALCQQNLGNDTVTVFLHARQHFLCREVLEFECSGCGVLFAYQLDLSLHSNNLDHGFCCRGRPTEPSDTNNWLIQADWTDRQCFVDLLRSWEAVQLRWYLRAIRKLLSGRMARKETCSSRTLHFNSHYHGTCVSNVTEPPLSRRYKVGASRSVYTASNISVASDMDDMSTHQMFTKKALTEAEMHEMLEAHELSSVEVETILVDFVLNMDVAEEPETGSDPCGKIIDYIRLLCKDNESFYLSLGVALNVSLKRLSSWLVAQLLRRLVSAGAELNTLDENGESPLYHAIAAHENAFATELINAGANVHHQSLKNGRSALYMACHHNLLDAVRLLLTRGAEVDLVDFEGRTPLMKTVKRTALADRQAVCELLRKHQTSAVSCSSQWIEYQIPQNGNPEQHSDFEWRLFRMSIIHQLLNHGADIDRRDKQGRTALMLATDSGNADAVRTLLERGADASIKDSAGMDAYDVSKFLIRVQDILNSSKFIRSNREGHITGS